jgi:NAD(P)-dependent dehydrogenase (short-subunit alcohol dehydrogenase family)
LNGISPEHEEDLMPTERTAIVTGGSRGLGLALATGLVERGWRVVVDARNADELAEATAGLGDAVVALPGDVTDANHVEALVGAAFERFGGVDAVVANASTLGPVPMPGLTDLAPAELVQAFAVNVAAPLALVQAVLRRGGLGRAGVVALVTSDAATSPYPGWGAYGTTKAALSHLGGILAEERPDLRVLVVDPGDMRTRMHADAFFGEDISDRPLPEVRVPAFIALLEGEQPSGHHLLVAAPADPPSELEANR